MALVSGTIAYWLDNMALKTIELSEAALFAYIHPAISAMAALILLGDKEGNLQTLNPTKTTFSTLPEV